MTSRSILTISGLTCAGKDHLARKLTEDCRVTKVISTTTRNPREGEVQGQSYYFTSREQFNERVRAGRFIESIELKGELYGIDVNALRPAFYAGDTALIICDPRGMESVRDYAEQSGVDFHSVFLDIDFEQQTRRLFERFCADTNADPGVYASRMCHIIQEEHHWRDYNYDSRFDSFDPETGPLVIEQVQRVVALMQNRADWEPILACAKDPSPKESKGLSVG